MHGNVPWVRPRGWTSAGRRRAGATLTRVAQWSRPAAWCSWPRPTTTRSGRSTAWTAANCGPETARGCALHADGISGRWHGLCGRHGRRRPLGGRRPRRYRGRLQTGRRRELMGRRTQCTGVDGDRCRPSFPSPPSLCRNACTPTFQPAGPRQVAGPHPTIPPPTCCRMYDALSVFMPKWWIRRHATLRR